MYECKYVVIMNHALSSSKTKNPSVGAIKCLITYRNATNDDNLNSDIYVVVQVFRHCIVRENVQ